MTNLGYSLEDLEALASLPEADLVVVTHSWINRSTPYPSSIESWKRCGSCQQGVSGRGWQFNHGSC